MSSTWCVLSRFRAKYGLKVYKSGNHFERWLSCAFKRSFSIRGDIYKSDLLQCRRTSASFPCIFSCNAHQPFNFNDRHLHIARERLSAHKSDAVTAQVNKAEYKRQLTQKKKESKRQERLQRQKLKEEAMQRDVATYDIPTIPGEKKDTSCPLPATYSSHYVEAAWYDWWQKEGFFTPEFQVQPSSIDKSRERFVVCLPPPNVTGTLHIGHALGNSIQDSICRWHRMHGRSVLWNPASDHAGIATQAVVEKRLWQERGLQRHDIGREQFIQEVWKWAGEKGNTIYLQMKRLGSSLDWTRDCFTLDEKLSEAVAEAFIRLHDEGLIYRRSGLVNWCCALNSAISDIEVDDKQLEGTTYLEVPGYENKVKFGTLTSIAYPLDNSNGDEIVIATTRPETLLGDTAVAVHPEDDRYRHLHGEFVKHPLCDRRLPIICDDFVDRNFGTGAVKITPAHDSIDYAVSRRHNLNVISVISEDGTMMNVPAQFLDQPRFVARKSVIEALRELRLIRGEQSHAMNLPICSRSGDVIEPLLKDQWYMNCDAMAEKAIQAVRNKDLVLIPDVYEKQWFDWLETIRDWCISRQLWWGHQIPAYKVTLKSGEPLSISDLGLSNWVSAHNYEEACLKATTKFNHPINKLQITQDEDVLDTWFSSAILPFSIFGWPHKTSDLSQFYPTDLLDTAGDIIYFWVARMVMMGQHLTGQLPFKQVLFHGILRDAQGRKMSKSLGNIIDPLDIIDGISLQSLHDRVQSSGLSASEVSKATAGQKHDFPLGIPQCGADALRFALCSYNFTGYNVNVDLIHVKSKRRFCNKIWQAFRFIVSQLGPDYQPKSQIQLTGQESATDRWILSRLVAMLDECDRAFKSYHLHNATQAIYDFVWLEFCDAYLEYSKPILTTTDINHRHHIALTQHVLYTCMDASLRALSPFMPYLTEELWQRLPRNPDHSAAVVVPSVCVAPYPHPSQYPWRDKELEEDVTMVRDIIGQCMSLKQEFNLRQMHPNIAIETQCTDTRQALENHVTLVKALTKAKDICIMKSADELPNDDYADVSATNDGNKIYMQLRGLIDADTEMVRLVTRAQKVDEEIDKMRRVYESEVADEHVVLARKQQLHSLEASLSRVKNAMKIIGKLVE